MTTAQDSRTTDAADEVIAGIRDMYDAFTVNDRERFDSHLHHATTTWESELPRMYTRADLDEFRDRRGDSGERTVVSEVVVIPQRVEVWGDTAVAAYLLRVVTPDAAPDGVTRVTDVLRRGEDGWRIVHHHAQDRDVDDPTA
ncbi:hypothetical protein CVS47_00309 [Microbacterium lemovicicum]|uniref:SnoaL-like domain-containing protein n=1 Tax=Microbacterium lemovicicum TaxID=1072463 RepID=A0A3S9W6I8_9MICO|nr:nuclear transport factor 2 family protein [Microbacterium lemovicicum]AZS35712.1 hypothetical protein CVS47_00309 [Microbacterium lemovicicum]